MDQLKDLSLQVKKYENENTNRNFTDPDVV
jgi:hypothetical protein